ncbi:MAG: EAL domain-containing protein, partial [Burkholderiales bacterium]|nr:EAL domain-containing protein [Burkholderiales bacterium]
TDLSIAVNLSPRNLNDAELPELVLRAVETWNAAPSRLILEITENAIMVDPVHSLKILNELNALGISLSIDDFGTGYSSLAYLRKLPVDELKVDRSFVMT